MLDHTSTSLFRAAGLLLAAAALLVVAGTINSPLTKSLCSDSMTPQ